MKIFSSSDLQVRHLALHPDPFRHIPVKYLADAHYLQDLTSLTQLWVVFIFAHLYQVVSSLY